MLLIGACFFIHKAAMWVDNEGNRHGRKRPGAVQEEREARMAKLVAELVKDVKLLKEQMAEYISKQGK